MKKIINQKDDTHNIESERMLDNDEKNESTKNNTLIFKKTLSKNYFRLKYLSVPLIDVFDMLLTGKFPRNDADGKRKRVILDSTKQKLTYPKSVETYVEHYKTIDPCIIEYKKSDILLISCVNGYIDIVYEMMLEETFLDDTYYMPLINEYNATCSPLNKINPWSRRRIDKLTKDWIQTNTSLKKFPSSQSSLCELCPFESLIIKAMAYIASSNNQTRLVKLINKLDYTTISADVEYCK